MSAFYFKKPTRFVFLHIPKTGGRSIRTGYFKANVAKPHTQGFILKDWDDAFKFAFVRHPLDRFVSAYRMFTEGTDLHKNPDLLRPKMTVSEAITLTLDESVSHVSKKSFPEKFRHHVLPQTHPFNLLHRADVVGRYESLEEDFEKILARMGLSKAKRFPHINRTQKRSWQEYLTGEDLKILLDYYREDCEKFYPEVLTDN